MVEQIDRLHKKLNPLYPVNDDNSRLVSLLDSGFNLMFEPSIKKDYKYLVREAVSEKIGRISKTLYEEEKILIIRSAWRSFEHQRMLWENKILFLQKIYPNKNRDEIKEIVSYFIAPKDKSMHGTGGSVDALIFDLKKDCVLDFGTNDGLKINLNKKCYPYHPGASSYAHKNRKLLITLFENENFVCDVKEYWHFDYGNVIWAIEKEKEHAIYGIIKESLTG